MVFVPSPPSYLPNSPSRSWLFYSWTSKFFGLFLVFSKQDQPCIENLEIDPPLCLFFFPLKNETWGLSIVLVSRVNRYGRWSFFFFFSIFCTRASGQLGSFLRDSPSSRSPSSSQVKSFYPLSFFCPVKCTFQFYASCFSAISTPPFFLYSLFRTLFAFHPRYLGCVNSLFVDTFVWFFLSSQLKQGRLYPFSFFRLPITILRPWDVSAIFFSYAQFFFYTCSRHLPFLLIFVFWNFWGQKLMFFFSCLSPPRFTEVCFFLPSCFGPLSCPFVLCSCLSFPCPTN